MNSNYIEFLKKQGMPLFERGGIYWRFYQGALIPASAAPSFVELDHYVAKSFLKESRAWFLYHASAPCAKETEWWYMICDSYNPQKLSSNTRSKIKRGERNCSVRRIDIGWLANNGYESYFSAFNRYKNAHPMEKDIFRNHILNDSGGPFEYWGVFAENTLAGYSKCILENNIVSTSVFRYHPAYLKYYTSYALVTHLIRHYVVERCMTINNGHRSIVHDTNFQDFLLKLGFRKQFCRLNVEFQPWLKLAVQMLFPIRKGCACLPNYNLVHKLKSLLYLEDLRRQCNVSAF